jgi:hypothetical protein
MVCPSCHVKGISCATRGYCGFTSNAQDICSEHAQYMHLCCACYAQETLDIADVMQCCYTRARKQARERLNSMP